MFFCRRQRERVYWSLGINTPSQTVWSNGLYLLFLSSSSALPFHSLPLPHISCTRCTATAGIHSFFNPSLLVSAVYLQSFILNHCNPYSVVSMEVVLSISCFAVSDIIIWCQKQFVNIFLYFYWIIWFYCLYILFFKNHAYFLFYFLIICVILMSFYLLYLFTLHQYIFYICLYPTDYNCLSDNHRTYYAPGHIFIDNLYLSCKLLKNIKIFKKCIDKSMDVLYTKSTIKKGARHLP